VAIDEPINRTLSGITLRSAMKIILEPLGLTYIIEDEVMKITTIIAADEKLSSRVYPVGDLVIPVTTPSSGGRSGGLGGSMGGMMGGGMGGGMGGMGGGMGGMGGGMGGMGFGSIAPQSKPFPKKHSAPQVQASKNDPATPRRRVTDPEAEDLLSRILNQK
jgi:hypothetical protein